MANLSEQKRIAIVGSGASGLAAIKCCLDENLIPVCFEREDDIGGLWNYNAMPQKDKGGTYKSCVINTSKEMMCFSDFPIPDEFPPFMPHHKVQEYFNLYAQEFKLMDYIQFKTSVVKVQKADNFATNGRWKLTLSKAGNDGPEISRDIFDGVMVCTGHHVYPHTPHFQGFDNFLGTKIHSKEYKVPDEFKDKAVLIIGIGNSAADIAVDVSRVAKKVHISTRRGAWIVSRMGPLGYPADAIANSRFAFTLPMTWLQWLVEVMANYRFDHDNYGLKAKHRALEAHPTINDELPYRIMVGAVESRPDVHHFTDTQVHFKDGTSEDIDAVIMATGYNYQYPFIDDSIMKVEKNEVELYKYVFPPHLEHPTLGVIGLVQAIGAVIPIAEMQARWFTRVIKGSCCLPPKCRMMGNIQNKKTTMKQQYVDTQRHRLQTFWISYMDEIANEIGAKPNLLRLLVQDPWLALRCTFGPCTPAQYRIHGPGQWSGAKKAIQSALANNVVPLKTRKVENGKMVESYWNVLNVLYVVGLMIILYYIGILL